MGLIEENVFEEAGFKTESEDVKASGWQREASSKERNQKQESDHFRIGGSHWGGLHDVVQFIRRLNSLGLL